MYHSITFGDKNTWDDWHIVPSSRPVIAPPSVKTKTIDIPGSNGLLDLSESLTGYPTYNNREGSFEFIVMNDYKEWYQAYSDIMDYLHGQEMTAILEDDKEYYYKGRFSVNEWRSEADYSRITIDYNVEPYKLLNRTSLEDWKWDPFNFRTGVIFTPFKNIEVTTVHKYYKLDSQLMGQAPFCPTFTVTSTDGKGVTVHFINKRLGIDSTKVLPNGTTQIPEFIFYGNTVQLFMYCSSETATVSIDFRQGRL